MAFPLEASSQAMVDQPDRTSQREIRRRTRSVGIFPNHASALRLIQHDLIEQTEDWAVERRYVSEESMQRLRPTPTTD